MAGRRGRIGRVLTLFTGTATAVVLVAPSSPASAGFLSADGWSYSCIDTTITVAPSTPFADSTIAVVLFRDAGAVQQAATDVQVAVDNVSATATLPASMPTLDVRWGVAVVVGTSNDPPIYFRSDAIDVYVGESGRPTCTMPPSSGPRISSVSPSSVCRGGDVTMTLAELSTADVTAAGIVSAGTRVPLSFTRNDAATLTLSVDATTALQTWRLYVTTTIASVETTYETAGRIDVFDCGAPALAVMVTDAAAPTVPIDAQSVWAVPSEACQTFASAVPLMRVNSIASGVRYLAVPGRLATGTYRILVRANTGYASRWWDSATCSTSSTVTIAANGTASPSAVVVGLLEQTTINLTITDPDTDPVEACVTTFDWVEGATGGAELGTACTDASGVVRLPGVGAGSTFVASVRPKNGQEFLSQFVGGSNDFYGALGLTVTSNTLVRAVGGQGVATTVALRRAGYFSGTVRNEGGNPVEGVRVFVIDSFGVASGGAVTDGNGEYEFAVDATGFYKLRFEGGDTGVRTEYYGGEVDGQVRFASDWDDAALVAPGPLPPIVLLPGYRQLVELRAPGGALLTSGCAFAFEIDGSPDPGRWAGGTCRFTAELGDNTPRATFGGLKPGTYRIGAFSAGYRTVWFGGTFSISNATPVPVIGGTNAPIVITLVNGVSFGVSLDTIDSTTLGGCVVAFVPTDDGGWGEPVADKCGTTSIIDGLPPSTGVYLRAEPWVGIGAPAWIGLAPDGITLTPVDLAHRVLFTTPATGYRYLGRLSLPTGRSISGYASIGGVRTSGVCVTVRVETGTDVWGTDGGGACSNSSGYYEIRGLPTTGVARLRFTNVDSSAIPEWYTSDGSGTTDPAAATSIDLAASPQDRNIDLGAGATIVLDVVDNAGVPASGVCALAVSSSGRAVGSGCSNSVGAATIRGLEAGTYRLWLEPINTTYRRGYALDDTGNPVEVGTGSSVQVTVTRNRRLTGVVTMNGAPIAGACVVASIDDPDVVDPVSCTGSDGKYSLTGLPEDPGVTLTVVDSLTPARFTSSTAVETGSANKDFAVTAVAATMVASAAVTPLGEGTVSTVSRTSSTVGIAWSTGLSGPYDVDVKIGAATVGTISTSAKAATLVGLAIGVTYRVTVSSGGTEIGTVLVTPAGAPPSAPATPTVSLVGSTLVADWPALIGAGAVTYTAFVYDDLGEVAAQSRDTFASAAFDGLPGGTSYTVRVMATNRAGNSPLSPPSDLVAITAGPPSAPTTPLATVSGTSITVEWGAPRLAGGTELIGYEVTGTPGNLTCSTSSTSCTFDALTRGTTYTFTVRAANTTGFGPSATVAKKLPGPPDAPWSVAASAGNRQVTVSWFAPVSDGGSPITSYTVTATPGGRTCTTTGTTSCTVTRLRNGTGYSFTVTAANQYGSSPPSASTLVVTPSRPPRVPRQLTTMSLSRSAVAVAWGAPSSDGGAPIVRYEIRYATKQSGTWSEWTSVGTSRAGSVSVPPGATLLIIQVRAVNRIGVGDPASISVRIR